MSLKKPGGGTLASAIRLICGRMVFLVETLGNGGSRTRGNCHVLTDAKMGKITRSIVRQMVNDVRNTALAQWDGF